jgi:NAD(P)-dependent dehydrogenase (short-subunit alcohol dehydrogenase family)
MQVALAARDTSKLADLVDETGALALTCDARRPDEVTALFERVENAFGAPNLVVYNASGRYRAAVENIESEKLEDAIQVTAVGGFLVAQAAAVRMLARGHGIILLTGATASGNACGTRQAYGNSGTPNVPASAAGFNGRRARRRVHGRGASRL